jgi:hypothetical protein|eukprot:CAMPEP_0181257146 /NCGR_PEP_ID=MMETSP1096-20121128/50090_1 /TAXON_ID=156174 ORGANISM="Chrysochromulina ericina, Strain CCMP281" /NCGR_SAMPLE_ID=MMETSP1096 /ASSEMBLY_ACC=CAM_ASM_000453 /LENGTH=209 /DNA_ID=CAMNT_0023355447 /DNA_START=207 /DNA_END=836 /DNA_ORIENTATION=+
MPVCKYNPSYAQLLQPYLLNATLQACNSLYNTKSTLHEHLVKLPEADGVRLMAIYNILGSGTAAGSDLLRSMANVLLLRGERQVLNLWMDELLESPAVALSGLTSFVLDSLERHHGALGLGAKTRRRDLGERLTAAHGRHFRRAQQQTRGAHITTKFGDSAASARKDALLQLMQRDLVLGQVHGLARSIFTWGLAPKLLRDPSNINMPH